MNDTERELAEKLYGVLDQFRKPKKFPGSGTAKMLQEKDTKFFQGRAKEEWKELTDEEHRHSDDFKKDFLLESSQFFYWLSLAAIVDGKSFAEFEKDFAKDLDKLVKLHAKNKIPLEDMFKKDLDECVEKGYL
ncbi:MAG: hypothetical protein ABIH35_03700 [Patescibacteria group bacterium]